jgi:hypothetical protein
VWRRPIAGQQRLRSFVRYGRIFAIGVLPVTGLIDHKSDERLV